MCLGLMGRAARAEKRHEQLLRNTETTKVARSECSPLLEMNRREKKKIEPVRVGLDHSTPLTLSSGPEGLLFARLHICSCQQCCQTF